MSKKYSTNFSLLLTVSFLSLILCGADYYRILGVSRNASKQQIKRAFKKLSLKYHPDKNKDNPERAKEQFIKIANAYEVLSDDKQRQIYDQFGEEGVKQHQQQQAQGGGGQNFGGFRFNFGGANFEDIFSQFFGGGARQGGGQRRGGKQKFQFNMGNFGNFGGFQEEEREKNHFENTDVVILKMDNLSQLITRRLIWFVLFYKSKDDNIDVYVKAIKELAEKCYGIFKVGAVNCVNDEEICDEYSVRDTPKVLFFPETGSEPEPYRGRMNFKAMFAFGSGNMQNFVRKVNKENYDDFISERQELYHVILFTNKKVTPPLLKAISKVYLNKLYIGEIKHTQKELVDKYNIQKFPTFLVVTNEDSGEYVEYKDEMNNFESIKKFLRNYAYKRKTEDKSIKFRQFTKNLYENSNMCTRGDGKNICFFYLIKKDKPTKEEQKLLMDLGEKYMNDHVKVFYVNTKKYPYFISSFPIESENNSKIKGFILKGKRKKFIPIYFSIDDYKNINNVLDNVISGGGNYKTINNKINMKENANTGDL